MPSENEPKFKLGEVRLSVGVTARSKTDDGFRMWVHECIGRYSRCDWGSTSEEDRISNNYAVFHGERIVAEYVRPDTEILIITEWDRSATTVMLSDEY